MRRLAGLAVLLLVAGCGGVEGTGTRGYTEGDGSITVVPAHDRHKPGEVSGTTLDGAKISLEQYAGHVVVMNVWGSWCPPCRKEAPTLAASARALRAEGVVFLGINTRDNSRDNAIAFEKANGVPYPSLFDPEGKSLLAFRGTLPLNTIPSTVIVDRQGRVAASILGVVSGRSTLKDVIEDVEK